MKKCNFKREAGRMFAGTQMECAITNERCVEEKNCVLYMRLKK